jgi:hypothetical protein
VPIDEDDVLEFKDYYLENEEAWIRMEETVLKTINAFLNHQGGRMFFGITDAGRVKGLKANRLMRDKIRRGIDSVINAMRPQVDLTDLGYRVDFVPIRGLKGERSEDRWVCAICINEDRHLPDIGVYFTDSSMSAAYRRAAACCQKMDQELIKRRIQYANENRKARGMDPIEYRPWEKHGRYPTAMEATPLPATSGARTSPVPVAPTMPIAPRSNRVASPVPVSRPIPPAVSSAASVAAPAITTQATPKASAIPAPLPMGSTAAPVAAPMFAATRVAPKTAAVSAGRLGSPPLEIPVRASTLPLPTAKVPRVNADSAPLQRKAMQQGHPTAGGADATALTPHQQRQMEQFLRSQQQRQAAQQQLPQHHHHHHHQHQ